MIYLTEDEVRALLPMRECIGLMRRAFEELASGAAINQPRRRLRLPTRAMLHYMAAGDGRYFGTKVYSTHPKHGAHFVVLLYRSADAAPLAAMEANYLGQIRTGAASGLATSLLARPDSRTVGIIGSGFQARSQLEALASVMPIEKAIVWSRSQGRREAFAAECAAALGLPVAPAGSAEEAVRGVDIVVTATSSAEPVLESGWVTAGTHVNAIGSNQARRRELPSELVRRADLIAVDSREQGRMEAGDLLLALRDEEWERVAELAELVAGRQGRRQRDDITIFKSNGLALEDVAAAGFVFEQALKAAAGEADYS